MSSIKNIKIFDYNPNECPPDIVQAENHGVNLKKNTNFNYPKLH